MAAEAPDAAPRSRADWLRHETRNHLNVLTGCLRLIEMGGVTPQQQKAIDQCRAAIDRIAAAVDTGDEPRVPAFATEAARELRALGQVHFLAKPFDRSDLLRTIQIAAGTHRNLRVLAADDVPEVGWLLETQLASTGATLDVVHDGAAAVERARQEPFSVILLDLEMPGMSGVDAARAIRDHERSSDRAPVPIVIASGHDLNSADDTVTPDPEVAPLVPEFLQNRRADVARVNMLIAAGEWEAVRALGHKMKGTGRGYGFPRITDIGSALEQAGAGEDAAAARAAAEQLQQYLDRVRVVTPPGS